MKKLGCTERKQHTIKDSVMIIIQWVKNWWYARLDKKYNNKTIVIPKADIKYPPPSAYEVKQIDEEFNLSKFSALQRIPPSPQWKLDANINKDLTHGN